ncbi:MAG TPA: Tn3 family transposase, partial [Isosphaeraceae bacterium]|nr:Tn3 family transposase [Isosphaeraceae bacterium]
RLIRNAIICWNYLYLSQLLAEEAEEERRQALLAALRNGSIVLWHHLNVAVHRCSSLATGSV